MFLFSGPSRSEWFLGFFHQLEGVCQTPYTYSWEGQERVLAFCCLHVKNSTTFIQTRKNLTAVFLHKLTYILATDSYVKEKCWPSQWNPLDINRPVWVANNFLSTIVDDLCNENPTKMEKLIKWFDFKIQSSENKKHFKS